MKVTISPEVIKLFKDLYLNQDIFNSLGVEAIPKDLQSLLKRNNDDYKNIGVDLESAIFCQTLLTNLKQKFDFLSNVPSYTEENIQKLGQQYFPNAKDNDEKIVSLRFLYNYFSNAITFTNSKDASYQERLENHEANNLQNSKYASYQERVQNNTTNIEHDFEAQIYEKAKFIIDEISQDLKRKIDKIQGQKQLIDTFCQSQNIASNTIKDDRTKQAIIFIQIYKEIDIHNSQEEIDIKAEFTAKINKVFGSQLSSDDISPLIQHLTELQTSKQLDIAYTKQGLWDKILFYVANIFISPNKTTWQQKIITARNNKKALQNFIIS